MPADFDPVAVLNARFAGAIARAFPQVDAASIDPQVRPSANPKFGDFQCNAAMGLAKALGMNPRQVAEQIVATADIADIAQPLTPASIAGPGFINITLRTDALADLLAALNSPSLGVTLEPAQQRTVVVDLCGVNLAKQMHVGHLRSTVIGDTLARILERLGHKVIRQNHVGDWGLPIAMVTARLIKLQAAGAIDLSKITLDDLDKAYKAAQRECDADERGLAYARAWGSGPKILAELQAQVDGALEAEAHAKGVLLKLQAHEPSVYAVWQRLSEVTMQACLAICQRLNADVQDRHSAGESSYSQALAGVIDAMTAKGLLQESDGALVCNLQDQGIEEPLIVRKRDGGYLYATTDLAGVRHRVHTLGADRVVYTVDARQSLHFKQVFAAARKAGFDTRPNTAPASLEHAAFGTILGEDGRPFKTRSGENVRLSDLLDQAEQRAADAVAAKNPELDAQQRRAIAWAVSVAAIRYTDLSTERIKDYTFNFDRMLAFEGNTGPYLLYALVRIKSIFRKAAERHLHAQPGAFAVAHQAEKALALVLLRYPAAVRSAGESLQPHRLCAYLYELAGAFASFFDQCPVLAAPEQPTRDARLRLCALAERVLQDGLSVLGIPTVDRM